MNINKKSFGIFIKTCSKDHEWLKWCLLSIKQNVSNFDGVCIVTDTDHEHIKEYSSVIKEINGKINYLEVPKIEHSCQDGIGYLWMQNTKLNWQNFCEFDTVLQIDSDCIVSSQLSPRYFILNNKYKWFVRNWGSAKYAQVHRGPLKKLFSKEIAYEHMPYNGWVLSREDTLNFHSWLSQEHNCSWWEYLLFKAKDDWGKEITDQELISSGFSGKSRGSSIYNSFGGFLELSKSENYIFIDKEESYTDDYPIVQFWSWGGISKEIELEIKLKLENSKIEEVLKLQDINLFDENFYIIQCPDSYQCLRYLPSYLNNKQKLFYHYVVINKNKKYLNRQDYENDLLGSFCVDSDFDCSFYIDQYPETKDYYDLKIPISNKRRLYHHYINYGQLADPPYCKNSAELTAMLTGIAESVPLWFSPDLYEKISPESKDYFMPEWRFVPRSYRLYHHYLNYGQHNHDLLIGLSNITNK